MIDVIKRNISLAYEACLWMNCDPIMWDDVTRFKTKYSSWFFFSLINWLFHSTISNYVIYMYVIQIYYQFRNYTYFQNVLIS